MHEYSVVSALIDRVEVEARGRGAAAVTRVQVRIGAIAGVDVDLLETAYAIARSGTICEDAVLDVRRVPAIWICPRCERPAAPGAPLVCRECGQPVTLASGDEIMLVRLELEVASV